MQHLDEGMIHSWLDGALSADEAARVEAHVKECPQCQAAVAEARGFIAASSRILTALDNAPRGVIPAAAPKRRIRMATWVSGFRPADPMVWRIAATVLVVAAGTLVVVRNSGLNLRTTSKEAPALTAARVPTPISTQPDTATTAGIASVAATKNARATSRPAPLNSGSVGDQGRNRSPAAFGLGGGGAAARDEARPQVTAEESRSATGRQRNVALEGKAAGAAPVPLSSAPPTRLEAAPSRTVDVAAMDAVAEEPALKVVGTPRRSLGQKLTSYEVAPGDTVVLTEELKVLDQVVTTGMGLAQPIAAAGAVKTRATAKAAAADTPRTSAAPAPARPASSPPAFVESPNGINMLTWTDSATGSGMKLSGRHSRAELEEIKRRIERVRATAADSVKRSR